MKAKFATLLAAATLLPSISAQTLDSVVVASGLSSPLFVCAPKNDFDRIFIVLQGGQIRIVENGTLLTTPFLNISSIITSGGEQGLLGMAFHPDYATNGYFFVNYSANGSGATVIRRYQVSANPNLANAASGTTFLTVSQPAGNHNGGCIQFGPNDGYLYVGMGDGGGSGDSSCNAQNPASLLGKMLRLDIDTNPSGPAIAPSSNPFVGVGGTNDLIWAFGLRNPWRFSFDRDNGDLWIGDVGQNAWEELNVVPGTSTGGENYGWKMMEGLTCFGTGGCGPFPNPSCNSPLLTDPIRVLPNGPNCSIIGGYVYRGCAIPSLRGTYLHTDFCTNQIDSLRWNHTTQMISELTNRTGQLGAGGSIRSFGEDAAGELYICGGSSVRKIVRAGGILTNNVAGPGSVGSDGQTPVWELCGAFDTGDPVTLRLRDTLPNAAAALIVGLQSNPVTIPIPGFGSLVPLPILFDLPLGNTSDDGIIEVEIPPSAGILPLYHQIAILDLGLAGGGVTLSNALFTIFNQTQPPVISTVDPLSAAPGTTISINGQSFSLGATLTVGGSPVTPTLITPNQIQFAMPVGVSCDSTVVVTNPDLQSDSAVFNPTPTVTNSLNNSGPAAGSATSFIIIGSGYSAGTTVTIGGTPANLSSQSATVLIVNPVPPGTIGPAVVNITTPAGCATTTTYTYF